MRTSSSTLGAILLIVASPSCRRAPNNLELPSYSVENALCGPVEARGRVLYRLSFNPTGPAGGLRHDFTNCGKDPVWMNVKLHAHGRPCVHGPVEVIQHLLDEGGREPPPAMAPDACEWPLPLFRREGGYRVLRPGETITGFDSPFLGFTPRAGGRYRVHAVYADPTGTPQPPPAGSIPFRGPLESNVIEVVAGARSGEPG